MNGKGTLTEPNGLKYIGDFKDNMKHGKGILTKPDKYKYFGEFQNDK